MKNFINKLISTFFFLFVVLICNAQSNLFEERNLTQINVDSYSDADILTIRNKMNNMGMDTEKAIEILKSKGMPSEEASKLENRLSNISVFKSKSIIAEPERRYNEGSNVVAMENANKDQSVFGSELFLKSSLVFEPNIRIATPSSYVVGPDDELVVNVFGYSEMRYNLEVNENGEVYIPSVGPIYLSGLTLEQATEKIKSKLASTIYRAISSGQTRVQIKLGKIRSIRVTVIGEAYKPGTYTISSLTTLYNVLYLCGGPSNLGSYRQIEVIRGNKLIKKADLYEFLCKGIQKDNILLQEGDLIRIPYYENRVNVLGSIKRAGKYEMLSGESVENLLSYCGGFNEMAYKGGMVVTRIAEKEKKILEIKDSAFSTFTINNGDDYYISNLQNVVLDKITITGSVYRPGNYESNTTSSLKSLLDKSGGLLEVAYTERVNIFRMEKGRQPSILSVNLDSIMNNQLDISLNKSDSVHVYSIFDFKDNQFVTILGNIRKSGRVQWRENLTVKELLLEAGGINDLGDSSTIEISRRKKKSGSNTLDYFETETFSASVSKTNAMGAEIVLMPFDIVHVKVLPGVINQRMVMVVGEVLTPGKYNLQKSDDRISDILKRVGGFKASADSSSIIIRRRKNSVFTNEERELLFKRLMNLDYDSVYSDGQFKNEFYGEYEIISIDLKKILKDKSKFDNLTLEDGDLITISKNNNLVKVSGEVYHPNILSLQKSKSAKYYIKQSGGFTNKARKMKTLIVFPNGKVKLVRSFLGFKFYPKVTSRAEIFVPQKSKENRTRIGAGEWALLVSAMGIISNVVLTALKN
ncbi:MAG: SLBB domain-containing protein [Sphingobacteriales bacterium]|nr:SLBB domain-containing protein [Sphingobacteriales bacterium]